MRRRSALLPSSPASGFSSPIHLRKLAPGGGWSKFRVGRVGPPGGLAMADGPGLPGAHWIEAADIVDPRALSACGPGEAKGEGRAEGGDPGLA